MILLGIVAMCKRLILRGFVNRLSYGDILGPEISARISGYFCKSESDRLETEEICAVPYKLPVILKEKQ